MQKPIITVLLLIIALTAATKIRSFIRNNAPAEPIPAGEIEDVGTICTMDALMCPDGTYVGRSGLKCEFVCPPVVATSTVVAPVKVKVGLNEEFEWDGVMMRVWAVTEDSRCPSDVQCIQAGRARLALTVGSSTTEMEVGQTVTVSTTSITLEEVSPYPISKHKTTDEEYHFSFIIKPE